MNTKINSFEQLEKLYNDNKDIYTVPMTYEESGKLVEKLIEEGMMIIEDSVIRD